MDITKFIPPENNIREKMLEQVKGETYNQRYKDIQEEWDSLLRDARDHGDEFDALDMLDSMGFFDAYDEKGTRVYSDDELQDCIQENGSVYENKLHELFHKEAKRRSIEDDEKLSEVTSVKSHEQATVTMFENDYDEVDYWFNQLIDEWEVLVEWGNYKFVDAAKLMNLDFDNAMYEQKKEKYIYQLMLQEAQRRTKDKCVEKLTAIILPPDNVPIIQRGSNEGLKEQYAIPRDKYLEELLEDMQFVYKIYEPSDEYIKEYLANHNKMDPNFYKAYFVKDVNKVVLVNNGAQNSTFVLHNIDEDDWLSHVIAITKKQMSELFQDDVVSIYWPSDSSVDRWKMEIRYFLEHDGPRYLSYQSLQESVRSAGVTNQEEYRELQKQHIQWPSSPDTKYKEWINWFEFFGKEKERYLSYVELQNAVRAARISSRSEYRQAYASRTGWPSTPDIFYREEWSSWESFLGLDSELGLDAMLNDLELCKAMAKELQDVKVSARADHPGVKQLTHAGYREVNSNKFLKTIAEELGAKYDVLQGKRISRKLAMQFIRVLAVKGEKTALEFLKMEVNKQKLTLESLYQNAELAMTLSTLLEGQPVSNSDRQPLRIDGFVGTNSHALLMRIGDALNRKFNLDKKLPLTMVRDFICILAKSGMEVANQFVENQSLKKYLRAEDIFNDEDLRKIVVEHIRDKSMTSKELVIVDGYQEVDVRNVINRIYYYLRSQYRGKHITHVIARKYIVLFHEQGKMVAEKVLKDKA